MLILLIGIFCAAMGVCYWLWVELNKGSVRVLPQPVPQAETNELLDLKRENERLKLKVAALPAVTDDAALLLCRTENQAFKAKIDEFSDDLRKKMQNIQSLAEEVGRLKADLSEAGVLHGVLEASRDDGLRKMHLMRSELEQLQIDNGKLKELAVPGTEATAIKRSEEESLAKVRELEMVNGIQLQKNEYLQNELTKARARMAGLERLHENTAQLSLMLGTDKEGAGQVGV